MQRVIVLHKQMLMFLLILAAALARNLAQIESHNPAALPVHTRIFSPKNSEGENPNFWRSVN